MIQTIHQTNNSAYITLNGYHLELFVDPDDGLLYATVSHESNKPVVANDWPYGHEDFCVTYTFAPKVENS